MAVFNWQGTRTLNPNNAGAQQNMLRPAGGSVFTVGVDMVTSVSTLPINKNMGILPKGARLNHTSCRVVTKVAGTNTDTVAIFFVPISFTIDTTAYIPSANITATTTGVYRCTDALAKSAAHFDKLDQDYCVILQYNAADNTGTVGAWEVIFDFDHDLDLTLD